MREYAKKPENRSRTLDNNPKVSRQAPVEVILQQYKERNKRYVEDEELIQGKFDTVQRKEIKKDELKQGKIRDNRLKIIQAVLEVKKSPKSPFNVLNYKIFKTLNKKKHGKKRIEMSIDQWVNLKKIALSKEIATFETWAEAVSTATDWILEHERKAKESEFNRQKVKNFLSDLECVRIGFIEGVNFGNIMSGLALMQSLNELGFSRKIVFVCSKSVKDKILCLNNKIQENNLVLFEETDEFSALNDYKTQATDINEKSISFMANGDTVDEETKKKVLNYMTANRCLIMNPYGWLRNYNNVRKLLYRNSVNEEDIQEVEMDKKIDKEALYVRNLEKPLDISKYIIEKLGSDNNKLKGILKIVEKVRSCSVHLQPVYGLHILQGKNLVNSEAVLSHGLYESKAAKERPIIILMLNNSRLDYIPQYSPGWLRRNEITDDNIDTEIDKLRLGKVMILDCNGLPDSVFTQIFRIASLPPLIEGANASNLVQLIGIPWMSPRTTKTEFPFADEPKYKNIISFLHQVRDSLTSKSEMSDHLEESSEYIHYNNLDAVYIRLNSQIKELLEKKTIGCSDLTVLDKEICTAKLENLKLLETISQVQSDKSKQESEAICEKLNKDDFNRLESIVVCKKRELKQDIVKSLNGKDYGLDKAAIASITKMIDDCMDDKSELRTYFQDVHESTKSDERDQVLQALLMLINYENK